MRCPACGARNPSTARWCNQCHTTWVPREAASAPGPGATAPAGRPAVRRGEDGGLVWDCPACGLTAPLRADACPACATSLVGGLARSRAAAPAEAVDPRLLLALTVVLPGAGHVAAGRHGSGLARILLYALWLSGGLALSLTPDARGLAVGAPLLLGALTLWLASLADTLALGTGSRQLAEGRVLLWLVVGVTGLALLGAMAAAATLAGPEAAARAAGVGLS